MQQVNRPFQAPGVCFICEASPDGEWVDTQRFWEPNGYTHLNGRKYLCEGCITQAAKTIGHVERDVFEHACLVKDNALDRADALAIRLAQFENFADAVKRIEALFPKVVEAPVEYIPEVAAINTKEGTITIAKVPRGRPAKQVTPRGLNSAAE